MLFISADLENSRYVYLSTAFWTIAVAGCVMSGRRRIAATSTAAIGLACIVCAIGTQWHLRAWREAASLRDQVLTAADAVVAAAPCPTVSLAAAPDAWHGAYVFRNGLGEAMARRGATPSALRAPEECTYAWTGSAFEPASGGGPAIQATVRGGERAP
jgi:hypothetical protein